MKKILVVGSKKSGKKNNPQAMAQSLSSQGVDSRVVFWEDMVFNVTSGRVQVTVAGEELLVDRPDLVLAVGWYKRGDDLIYRDVAYSLSLILDRAGITYWNSEMGKQRSISKLSATIQLALNEIPVVDTTFSLDPAYLQKGDQDFPMIAKAIAASRGDSNYLVHTFAELQNIFQMDSGPRYLIQPFMQNDHDIRVICFGGEPSLVMRRSRHADSESHLNNSSKGADTTWLELSALSEDILTICRKICIITNREMAGIDFIPSHGSTSGYACLEVNAIPQLTSGTDVERKMSELTNVLKSL